MAIAFSLQSIDIQRVQSSIAGPVLDKKVKVENGTMVGPLRVDDVRKDMYQLLATTPDPRFVSFHTTGFGFLYVFESFESLKISWSKAIIVILRSPRI